MNSLQKFETENTANNLKYIKINKNAKVQSKEEDISKQYYVRNVDAKALLKKCKKTILVKSL